jgi:hypothetical protein
MDKDLKQKLFLGKFSFVGILIVLIFFHFRKVFDTYAISDAYYYLNFKSDANFKEVFFTSGRYLYGILYEIFLSGVDGVAGLWVLRLFALINTCIFAVLFFRILEPLLKSRLAFAATLLLVATPSFAVFTAWSATFQAPLACWLSLLSGHLAAKYIHSRRLGSILLSVCLGLAALHLYQPCFTLFIIPLCIQFLKDGQVKNAVILVAVYFSIYVVYYLSIKALAVAIDLPLQSRGGFNFNIIESINWLFFSVMKNALSLSTIFHAKVVRKLTLFLSLVLLVIPYLVFYIKGEKRKGIVGGFALIPILILAVLPNFITEDQWFAFRKLPGIYAVIILHVGYVFFLLMKEKNVMAQTIFMGIIVLFSLWTGNKVLNQNYIDVQKSEWQYVSSFVAKNPPNEQILVKRANKGLLEHNGYLRRHAGEIGFLSTFQDWVPRPMIELACKENGLPIPEKIEVVKPKQLFHDHLYLDMNSFEMK